MSILYTIEIDREDAQECPDQPWTAQVADERGEYVGSGSGATIAQAVAAAVRDAQIGDLR